MKVKFTMQKTGQEEFLDKVGTMSKGIDIKQGKFENLWITVGGNKRFGMHRQREDVE